MQAEAGALDCVALACSLCFQSIASSVKMSIGTSCSIVGQLCATTSSGVLLMFRATGGRVCPGGFVEVAAGMAPTPAGPGSCLVAAVCCVGVTAACSAACWSLRAHVNSRGKWSLR